jgi:hypothetical protein
VSTAKLAEVLVVGTVVLLRRGIRHVFGTTKEEEEVTWEFTWLENVNEEARLVESTSRTAEVNILDHDGWVLRSRFVIVYASLIAGL